eukprot:5597875-Pleurochrysis_carterae.AAC.1
MPRKPRGKRGGKAAEKAAENRTGVQGEVTPQPPAKKPNGKAVAAAGPPAEQTIPVSEPAAKPMLVAAADKPAGTDASSEGKQLCAGYIEGPAAEALPTTPAEEAAGQAQPVDIGADTDAAAAKVKEVTEEVALAASMVAEAAADVAATSTAKVQEMAVKVAALEPAAEKLTHQPEAEVKPEADVKEEEKESDEKVEVAAEGETPAEANAGATLEADVDAGAASKSTDAPEVERETASAATAPTTE